LTRKAEQATYTGVDLNNLTQAKRDDLASRTDAAHRSAQGKILRDLQDADTVFYSINPSGASVTLNKISRRAQIGWRALQMTPAEHHSFRASCDEW
jgi:hypothetical protein